MTNNIYFIANWKMYGSTSSLNTLNGLINLSKLKKYNKAKIIYFPPSCLVPHVAVVLKSLVLANIPRLFCAIPKAFLQLLKKVLRAHRDFLYFFRGFLGTAFSGNYILQISAKKFWN